MDEVWASSQNPDVQEQRAVMSWQFKNLPCILVRKEFHIILQKACEQTILTYKHENYFYIHNTLIKKQQLYFTIITYYSRNSNVTTENKKLILDCVLVKKVLKSYYHIYISVSQAVI